jgi:vacuolar-type H+-ATPase subunit I/STV1
MFRSKDMELMKVILSMESAWDVVNFIGQREAAMIVHSDTHDYSSAKAFVNRNKLLENWQQRLTNLVAKCEQFGVKYISHLDRHERIARSLNAKLQESRGQNKTQIEDYFVNIESRVKNLEDYFKNFDDFTQNMKNIDYTSAILRNLNAVIPPGIK